MDCDSVVDAEAPPTARVERQWTAGEEAPPEQNLVPRASSLGPAELDVLVVEDDADDYYLVQELLRSELAAETQQACSVDEALDCITGTDFDAILLDYTLGAKTGLDLLAEFRESGVTTPVIFLTGHGDEELAVRALKAGAVDYLPKARLNASSLASAIRHALALREKDDAVRQAREELSQREREYRMLFEDANDAILIFDAETEKVLAANPAASRLYECSHAELLGLSLIQVSTDNVRGRAAIEECLATGRLSNYENVHLSRQGRRIHILANTSAIEYRGRRALLGVFRDISERKAAEEEKKLALQKLHESELRYRTLFERNLAGVFRARADSTLLEANQAFLRMLGYDRDEEVTDLRLNLLCAAAGCVEPWCAELASAGQLIDRELRILRKDGSTASLLANLVLLRDAQGQPESIEGTVLDVTQRRQLEAQLLQSQKMDAIGQLAGGIAHDFNNLLMVMRSYAELAAEAIQDAEVRRQLDAILKATDRGAALTRQLLTFGRKQVFSPRLLSINSVLENMVKVLPRALGEDVRVEVRAAPDLCQVKADPVQIEQLILNLAVNARDAMPGGGRLLLETSNQVLDSDYVKLHVGVTPGDYVMLAVSDTGPGIPREILPRIFEPFFTTKERGKGTGLGLSTVYGIVKECGGFVWVYSEPSEGAVFKIYLPSCGAAAVLGTSAVKIEVPLRGVETVLLVEDEEPVRTAARAYLALRGYTVLEAGCGEEALRISDGHSGNIDLLVTDAVMPGMRGSALGREIVRRRPGIRIIYVSGYTEAAIGEAGGAFLQKPFSLAVLAQKVREVLDAAPARAPRVA